MQYLMNPQLGSHPRPTSHPSTILCLVYSGYHNSRLSILLAKRVYDSGWNWEVNPSKSKILDRFYCRIKREAIVLSKNLQITTYREAKRSIDFVRINLYPHSILHPILIITHLIASGKVVIISCSLICSLTVMLPHWRPQLNPGAIHIPVRTARAICSSKLWSLSIRSSMKITRAHARGLIIYFWAWVWLREYAVGEPASWRWGCGSCVET